MVQRQHPGEAALLKAIWRLYGSFYLAQKKPEEYQVKGKGNKNEYFLLVFVMNFYPDS